MKNLEVKFSDRRAKFSRDYSVITAAVVVFPAFYGLNINTTAFLQVLHMWNFIFSF